MAVEQAIVNFVVQGALEASQKADKVEADLRDVERAGRRASTAAERANQSAQRAQIASKKLHDRAMSAVAALGMAAAAAGFLGRVAEGLGAGRTGTQIGAVLGETAADAAIGAQLGSFVPGIGTVVGAGIGAGLGLASSAVREFGDDGEQQAAQAKATADEMERRQSTVEKAVEHQALVSALGARFGRR